MKDESDIWLNSQVEGARNLTRRRTGRVAFDCFNLKVKGDRVYCAKGHMGEQTYDLWKILEGYTPRVCEKCEDFDDKDEVI